MEARRLDLDKHITAFRWIEFNLLDAQGTADCVWLRFPGVHSPAVRRALNSGYAALWHKADAFSARDCDKTRYQNRHWRPVPEQSLVREYAIWRYADASRGADAVSTLVRTAPPRLAPPDLNPARAASATASCRPAP